MVCFPEKINEGQFYTLPNFRHKSPSAEWAPRALWGLSGPGSRLAAARAQSGPPLPPTGAVPAHHHPHHERRGQALRLPLRLPHLPVFLHDDAGHPLLKLLHSGMFKRKQSAKHETERLCVMVLISPVKHYGSAGLLISSDNRGATCIPDSLPCSLLHRETNPCYWSGRHSAKCFSLHAYEALSKILCIWILYLHQAAKVWPLKVKHCV